MAFPSTLNELPSGTQATLDLIAEFDQCFLVGFANLSQQHQQTLNALQRVFRGTPLQQPLTDACAAISALEFVERHFSVLAAVRAALQGVLFDTLQTRAREVIGRAAVPEFIAESKPPLAPAHLQTWLESVRLLLMEIALVGYARLDASTLIPFLATLGQIQEEPLLMRQAALLTGFLNELIGLVPVAESSTVPSYRWVDLWTRAMVGAMRPTLLDNPKIVSGSLEVLGLDLRHHANLVSFTAYGLLTSDSQVQLVRLTLSAYKVNAISDDEVWLLFPDAAPLLDAFAQNKTLDLSDIPLLPTGDLLWSGNGKVGSKYNLMKRAAEFFAVDAASAIASCLVHPIDRHPIQLAEPIFLSDYRIAQDNTPSLSWGDAGALPIATEQISPLSEVMEATLHSSQMFGLLRFDAGRWAVQPLAVTVQGKTFFTGQKAAKILKSPPKTSTVGILQERASRLLRAK